LHLKRLTIPAFLHAACLHFSARRIELGTVLEKETIFRAVSNFEDVFGQDSRAFEDICICTDTNDDEDYESTLQGSPGPSDVVMRQNLQKRRFAEAGVATGPNSMAFTTFTSKAKRTAKGKEPVRSNASGDSQMLLKQSHLLSDALRVNEFVVDLSLQKQRHANLAESTRASYKRYQDAWEVIVNL
jgi:hypothetical protein